MLKEHLLNLHFTFFFKIYNRKNLDLDGGHDRSLKALTHE